MDGRKGDREQGVHYWDVVHVRKKRKVSRVMGWLLSLQLSEPGWGICCALSIVRRLEWVVMGGRAAALSY